MQGNVLVNIALADVFVHSVGAYKSSCGRSISLSVEELRAVIRAWQQGSTTLHAVFFGQAVFGQRGSILRIIFPCARDCVLHRQSQRSSAYKLIRVSFGLHRIATVTGECNRDQAQDRGHEDHPLVECASAMIWHRLHHAPGGTYRKC